MRPDAADSVHISELPRRVSALAGQLAKKGLDAAVLLDAATVTYFSGNQISGPNILIVTAGGECTVVCDEYDAHNFTCLGIDCDVIAVRYFGDPAARAAELLVGMSELKNIGLEFSDIRHSTHATFAGVLADRTIVPIDEIVGDLRLPKSDGELAQIRVAAAAVEEAFKSAQDLLNLPINERQLAAAIYDALLKRGSDYVAGQPYVKSAERALNTHARWSGRDIAISDHVLLEIGGCAQRYHAALMRTRLPDRLSPSVQRAVDAVRAGRDAHLSVIRPGVTAAEIHEAYLAALDKYSVAAWNRHSSGYPLGIAFPPYWGEIRLMTLTRGASRRLEAGMVLHVISGLTEPAENVPHVGLSECVLVTDTGWERLINVDDFL